MSILEKSALEKLTTACFKKSKESEKDYKNYEQEKSKMNQLKKEIEWKSIWIKSRMHIENQKTIEKQQQKLQKDQEEYVKQIFKMREERRLFVQNNRECKKKLRDLINSSEIKGLQFAILLEVVETVLSATKAIAENEKQNQIDFEEKDENDETNCEGPSHSYLEDQAQLQELMNNRFTENSQETTIESIVNQVKATISKGISTFAPNVSMNSFSDTCRQETEDFSGKITAALVEEQEKIITVIQKHRKQEADNLVKEQQLENNSYQEIQRIKENEEKERQRILEWSQQQADEYIRRSRKQNEENEEKLRKIQEERIAFEKETKRQEAEDFENFQKCTDAIFQCILAQYHFEQEEKKWSKWLEMLQKAIANAKDLHFNFEQFVTHEWREQDVKTELRIVYFATKNAYRMIYKAWNVIKMYSETFPDKIFLRILLVNFLTISDKLCDILECFSTFDVSNADPGKQIRNGFLKVDAFEVYTTAKLRKDSINARMEDYLNIEEPRFFETENDEEDDPHFSEI